MARDWLLSAVGCALWLMGPVACADPSAPVPEDEDEDEDEPEDETEADSFSDTCTGSSRVVQGFWESTLSGHSADLSSICGADGPNVFARLKIPRRADVTVHGLGKNIWPTVGVIAPECLPDHELLCTTGMPSTLYDVPEGAELVVAVAVADDDPWVDDPDPDALGFGLDIDLRAVLELEELCQPPELGRCETGTACLPELEDPEHDEETFRCRLLAGDTCAEPHMLVVDGDGEVELPGDEIHSDAHHHSCAGARHVEAVYRLQLDAQWLAGLDPGAGLEISTEGAGVALAVRTPGCLPDQEIACALASDSGAVVLIPEVAAVAANGAEPFLFVELPASGDGDGGENEPPQAVLLSLKAVDA